MRPIFRIPALSCLGLMLLAGCLASPAPEDVPAVEAAGEPAARSSEGDGGPGPRLCKRVWSAARADSIWNCPDPAPPSAP